MSSSKGPPSGSVMSKHSLVLWPLLLLLLLWGFGWEGGVVMFFLKKKIFFFFGWKICNVSIMFLLLYVHVRVTRTGWKTRPWPKTAILPIKKSNQIKSNLSAAGGEGRGGGGGGISRFKSLVYLFMYLFIYLFIIIFF